VRDAVKKKLPDGVPKPGKFRLPDAAAAETPAADTAGEGAAAQPAAEGGA
jgi:hypothetical protein